MKCSRLFPAATIAGLAMASALQADMLLAVQDITFINTSASSSQYDSMIDGALSKVRASGSNATTGDRSLAPWKLNGRFEVAEVNFSCSWGS
ncbi:MAG: hypothetical protein WD468_07560 [Pirellulales bacterium]